MLLLELVLDLRASLGNNLNQLCHGPDPAECILKVVLPVGPIRLALVVLLSRVCAIRLLVKLVKQSQERVRVVAVGRSLPTITVGLVVAAAAVAASTSFGVRAAGAT